MNEEEEEMTQLTMDAKGMYASRAKKERSCLTPKELKADALL